MQVAVNHLPVLTWNALKLNHTTLSTDAAFRDGFAPKLQLPVGVTRQTKVSSAQLYQKFRELGISNPKEAVVAGKVPMYNAQIFATGMGGGIDALMDQTEAQIYTVESSYESDQVIKIQYRYPEGAADLQRIFIHAKAGSESTFLLYFAPAVKECEYLNECGRCEPQQELLSQKRKESAEEHPETGENKTDGSDTKSDTQGGLVGVQTYLLLEEGARVHFHTVQMLDPEMTFFHDIGIYGMRDSVLTATKLDLGALTVYEGLNALQAGDRSSFSIDYGTLGLPGSKIDINYNDVFTGKNADGRMYFKEALLGDAQKTFRGTVDFRQYSTGSNGDEQEDIILLGEDIVNKTIPLILCEEEDVEGRHAATVGSLSEDMLFYMQSRGIGEEKAKELMVRASLQHISNMVPSESIKKAVLNAICRVFE